MTNSYAAVLAFEKFASHKDGSAVAFEDGHVVWMGEAEARELIERQMKQTIEALTRGDEP